MKAIVFESYGPPDVLRLGEVDTPTVDGDGVLVRVRAASVNPYDWHFMTGLPYVMRLQFGLRNPPVDRLGGDVSGTVAEVGSNVTRFRTGDEVFGSVDGGLPDQPMLALGTLAEYVCVPEDWLEPKPAGLTFDEAAAVPLAAITALQGLRDYGEVRAGQRVLINGSSGGVGTFAVQIAKAFGAEVTAVCSTPNVEMVRSIGADHVVDYTRDDFTRRAERYDLMMDNVGNRTLRECRSVLTTDGMYLASFGQPHHRWLGPFGFLLRMKLMNRFVSQRFLELDQHRKRDDLGVIKALIDSGEITPVIDRRFALSDSAQALAYLETGRARGKVIVTM